MRNIFATKGATTLRQRSAEFKTDCDEFARKALHHLRKHGTDVEVARASQLLGEGGVLSTLAANPHFRLRVTRRLFKLLKKVWRLDPSVEFRFVTVIYEDLITSDEATNLLIDDLNRRSRRVLSAMSPHFVAVVEIQGSTNIKHSGGGKAICPHVHAIVMGHKLRDRAFQVADRVNERLGKLSNGMHPVDVSEACSDVASLMRAVFYPYKLPHKTKTLYLNTTTGRSNLHESVKGDRYVRFERLFEVLSLIPLRSLMFAGGDGRYIKTAALRQATQNRAEAYGSSVQTTEASIRAFWAQWRNRMKTERFSPPRIILRHKQ